MKTSPTRSTPPMVVQAMSKQTLPKLMLSVPEVAASTGFEEWRVKRLLKEGALPSVKVGRGRFVRMRDLERYIDGLEASLPQPDERHVAAAAARHGRRVAA